jgi:hypothetical protein
VHTHFEFHTHNKKNTDSIPIYFTPPPFPTVIQSRREAEAARPELASEGKNLNSYPSEKSPFTTPYPTLNAF